MTVQIRPANTDDHAAVMQLAERLADFELPSGREREQLIELDAEPLRAWFAGQREGCHLLVAELDGAVVAFALLVLRPDPIDASPAMHLQALAVAIECAGQGIGRRLIAACEDLARETGVATLTLNAFSGNGGARSLYRHLGFIEEAVSYRKPL